MNLCIACKYFDSSNRGNGFIRFMCRHNQIELLDVVTGEPFYSGKVLYPYKARKNKKLCGENGTWFEPIVAAYPPESD